MIALACSILGEQLNQGCILLNQCNVLLFQLHLLIIQLSCHLTEPCITCEDIRYGTQKRECFNFKDNNSSIYLSALSRGSCKNLLNAGRCWMFLLVAVGTILLREGLQDRSAREQSYLRLWMPQTPLKRSLSPQACRSESMREGSHRQAVWFLPSDIPLSGWPSVFAGWHAALPEEAVLQ